MTAATTFRDTPRAGLVPSQGSYGMAADIILLGGTIATVDSAGRADVVTAGQPALGICDATYDNRTTAPEGGGADAVTAEVSFGVFELAYSGSAPVPGDVLYVVDNQTVNTDSSSGTRGIAGYCVATSSTGYTWVQMGPAITAQIVIASTEAEQLDTAQDDIDNLQTDMAVGRLPVTVRSGTLAAGTVPGAFSDGVSDGFVVSENVMYRWNVASTAALWFTVPLPEELDDTADVEIHMLVSREGSADTTTVVTATAFFQVVGSAYTADANCGGNSGAIDQATTVVSEESIVLAAADVPAGPCALSFSLVPSAALDADDLNLHAVWIEYTRKLTASS